MCRSIRPLHRAEVEPTELDVRDAAVQYVRKLSGIRSPSKADAPAFEAAVEEVAAATDRLLAALRPAPPSPVSFRVLHLTFDCADPGALAGFWCAALGYTRTDLANDFVAEAAPP